MRLGHPAWSLVALLLAWPAWAGVQTEGAPRLASDTPGLVFADQGSTFGIRAEVQGLHAGRPGSFVFHDARDFSAPDSPLGTFSLRILDGGTERLEADRRIAFRPWGWEEAAQDGALSSAVRVFTLDWNVFAVVLEVHGVTAPLTVEARLERVGDLSVSATVDNPVGGTSALVRMSHDGGNVSAGIGLGGTGTVVGGTATDGPNYVASLQYSLDDDGTLGFVVAFDAQSLNVRPTIAQVLSAHGAPGGWLAPVQADWDRYLASYAPAHDATPARLDADRQAMAILRHNLVAQHDAAGVSIAGGTPAKGHQNYFYAWETALAALGASESSGMPVFELLEGVQRAQVTSGDEQGLIPHHTNLLGQAVGQGAGSGIAAHSAPPLLPGLARILYERSEKDDAAREHLERAYQVQGAYLNWWTRRRDKDGDGLAESNGGTEGGAPDSPRFLEVWGDNDLARKAVDDADARLRLNTADLNAWRYLGDVELSRVGALLGKEDAVDWLRRAGLLGARIDDSGSFWDTERSGYFDYTRSSTGTRTFVQSQTPAMWWPLVTGAVRDPARVAATVNHILSPTTFWGTFGIPSLAFTDPRFSARLGERGPVSPPINYFTAVALYRYGYEAEAEQLRQRTLDLIAARPCAFESYDPITGDGLGACGDAGTAAVYLELMRNRHQEEAFATARGGPAALREGRLRRLFRLGDGSLLCEVTVEGTYEVPVTHIQSATQIFADEPMTFTFTDPGGVTGGRTIRVTLPELVDATIRITRADGTVETSNATSKNGPIAFTARVGDTVELPAFRLTTTSCGCTEGGGAALGSLCLAALALVVAKRPRRARRREAGGGRGK